MGWQINNNGWWGEGEIKFFIDGDGEFPTICGTGTEDYFGGSYERLVSFFAKDKELDLKEIQELIKYSDKDNQ